MDEERVSKMNNVKIAELLRNGEGLSVEFKRCSGLVEHDVSETICALLNRDERRCA